MSAAALLARLKRRDIRLWAEGDQLRYDAPRGALTSELRRAVVSHKAELLEILTAVRQPAAAALKPMTRSGELPMSFGQQRLWFLEQLDPGNVAYNLLVTTRLGGPLDVPALSRALGEITRRHETLRSRFPSTGGQPRVVIAPAAGLELEVEGLESVPAAERLDAVLRRVRQESARPFDLARGPLFRMRLFRLAADDHVLHLGMHHIVSDGWSLGVLFRELDVLYRAFHGDLPSPLDELAVQYLDFADWQRRRLEGPAVAAQLAYWRRQLAGETAGRPPVLDLPTDRPRPLAPSHRGGSIELAVPADLPAALHRLALASDATVFMTLMAVFQVLLTRISGGVDVVVGAPIAGRQRPEVENLIGFFVSNLVLRVDLAGDPSFRRLLSRVRRVVLDAFANSEVPFEKLVEELQPERELGRNPLFQVLFNYFNLDGADDRRLADLEVEALREPLEIAKFDLSLQCVDRSEGLLVVFQYSTDLFDAATIERLGSHYLRLLQAVVEDAERPISRLPLLAAEERRQLLVEWGGSGRRESAARTVVELFEAAAERSPAALALAFEERELTYRQLERASAQLARRLRARGVGPEVRVALCLERSWRMIVAVLGVLRAGGAYVPLDPGNPEDRLAFLIDDSGARVVLSQVSLTGLLRGQRRKLLAIDDGESRVEPGEASLPAVSSDQLAYVIYTSGSTGKPKGVEIGHRQLATYVAGMLERLALPPGAGFATVSTLAADLGNTAIFAALASGGALHILSDERIGDADRFGEILHRRQIDCVKIVPSHLEALLAAAARPREVLPRQLVVLGGEASSWQLIRRIQTLAPGCAVLNHYGPTETTVGVSTHRVGPGDGERFAGGPPIGRPLSGATAYLLDRRGGPVSPVAVGELYLGGRQVARGYLGRPRLTAERFVPDPFGREPGGRLYRTGDLARWAAGGELTFLGRDDHQVKIRGFRVELAEIEAVLARHPAVSAGAVLAIREAAGAQRLVAYVVAANSSPPPAELRDYLKERLPDYMVPSSFVALNNLPLTANGKLDRGALPAPETSRSAAGGEYAEPRTPAERTLAGIWSQVLQVERVGVHDNYFDLGGESILSIQIVSRANREGLRLTPRDLFLHPTVGELAAVAGSTVAAPAEQGAITGPVPLTPIQHRFFELPVTDPHHYNHARLLELCQPVDGELVRRGVTRIVAHHDLLRARYRRRGAVWEQWVAEPGAVPFARFDLSRLAETGGAIESLSAQFQASLDLTEGPILRVALFELGSENTDRLLIVVHHLAVDGVSWQILVEDLASACRQPAGKSAGLPPKTTSYREWARRLGDHARTTVLDSQLAFWQRAAGRAARRLPVDLRGGDGAGTGGAAGQVSVSLSREETGALLRDVPGAYRTGIDDVLLTALAQATTPWTGSSALLLDLEGHGREDLFEDVDLSRSVGWFTAVYPVLLDLAGTGGPGEALKAVKEQLRRIPGRGLGWGLLRYLRDEQALRELPPAEISFNYLGRLDREVQDSALFARAPEAFGPLSSRRNRRRYLLDVVGSVQGGELEVHFIYNREVHEHGTVERLAEGFRDGLRQLIAHCTAPGTGGLTPSDFPLARLAQRTLEILEERYREPGIEDVYRLSPLQAGVLFHTLAAPESGVYVTQLSCVLAPGSSGPLDPATWRRAWQQTLERQPALRTAFLVGEADEIHQVVCRRLELPWRELDLRSLPAAEQSRRILRLERSQRRGFDLEQPPLLRLALARLEEDRYQFVSTHHHALLDGWSLPLLLGEVFETYAGVLAGRACLRPPAQPFSRHIEWLARQDHAAAEAYWRRVLAGVAEPAPLPGVLAATGAPVAASELGELCLSPGESSRLESMAREHRLTLNTVVLGAWAILLSRLGGRRHVTHGVTVAGRPADLPGVEEMIGSFINTLPLTVEIGQGPAVETLRRLQERQAEMLLHEHFALYEIQALAGRAGRPLFDCLFVFENYPSGGRASSDQPVQILEPRHVSQASYPLVVVVQPGSRLRLQLRYEPKLFDGAAISALLAGLRALLASLGTGVERPIADLPLISESRRRQLTAGWQAPSPAPPASCLHQLFERRAAERPQAVAVVSGDEQLSYGALDRRADRLARRLHGLGVRPGAGTLVGLSLERGPELVVAMLGILKAGAAYLPLDLANPAERIAFILEDTRVPVLITTRDQLPKLPRTSALALCLDDEQPPRASGEALPPVAVRPEDPAYVIYTSGSTGRPKGVVIEHRSAVRLFTATETWFDFDQDDVWTLFHSAAFDFSVWEIWGALIYGGRLVVVPYRTSRSPEDFLCLLRDQRVSVLNQTPSAFRPLIRAAEAMPAGAGLTLDWVIFGGEALDLHSLVPWLERRGDERPRLINMYGITETTVHVTYRRIRAAEIKEVPGSMIGEPIPDLRLCVLDRCFQPIPAGAPGELFVGGPGVARGYLQRPRLTAERFLPDLFSGRPGARLYRTGDLGRFLPDGDLEYLGRNDAQVQLRGFRVELGEIEAALLNHPRVAECVVLLRAADQEGLLVAFVVGESPAGAELRVHLKERLPEYMVPSAFVTLDAVPLTANGKVDRAALSRSPLPAGERQAGGTDVAPRTELEERISAIWRRVLAVDAVGARDNFFDLGGHSLRLLRVQALLQEELGRELSIAELFEHPTIEALVRHLEGDREADPEPAPLSGMARRPVEDSQIAVIGLAGRFPGAADVETFWQNLENGVESIRFFTDDELRQAGVPEAELSRPDYVKARAVLDGVDLFDARFFGYSPREAELIDPQQRVFLECASQALDRAGYDPDRYDGMIGVYAGVSMNGYLANLRSRPELLATAGMETLLAADKDFIATRVSYKLGLRGPSLTVQTACSTSLVAVHQACRSLIDGQCDLAMAGGAAIPVPVIRGYRYVEQGIRSPDGHCRAFDARAQGTVSGSGVAVVVLKRLAEALADGDRIHALIRGTAINNDGSQKVGFTAPSVEGQARVIATAQAVAGVEPESIGYVETHGTGTALGDPIEIAALEKAFGKRSERRGYCALGSLKSNMGHLNDAAGVAGLIKTVLALEHRRIPASLHFESPNPEIDFDRSPFYVNAECRPWESPGDQPRRAGVSSFGIGGTNAHVVLEEAPPVPAPAAASRHWQLLPMSARSGAALERMTADLAGDLGRRGKGELADVAYTLQVGRRRFEHRRAVLCRDAAGAVEALEAGGPGVRWTRRSPDRRGVVFLFSGQGAQYADMGRGLYSRESAFRDAVDVCLEQLVGETDFDLRAVLYPRRGEVPDPEVLRRTAVAQPALFVVEYALAQLWRSWGIEPEAMIGHSLGELVAACVSGVLPLGDALRLVALRGRLMESMPSGAMLSVPLPAAEVESLLADTDLEVAAINAPVLCAVSGPEAPVERFSRRLAERGLESRRLHTSHAFHSASMDGAVPAFVEAVRELTPQAPRIPYLSGVTGDWVDGETLADPGYWGRQIRSTVRFADGLDRLLAGPERVLLEVGPGRVLGSLARLQDGCGAGRPVIASLRHPQDESDDEAFLLAGLGQLWTAGVEVDWAAFHDGEARRRVTLPAYPFERQRYWIEKRPASPVVTEPARRADVADWFYMPSWRRTPAPEAAPPASEPVRCLAFVAGSGLDNAVVERLTGAGREVVTVTPGAAFERAGTGYRIDPGSLDDARRLIAECPPGEIVHLWSLGGDSDRDHDSSAEAGERCLQLGFYSLMHLARALGDAEVASPVAIQVVTDRVFEVVGGEAVEPEKAAALGPCRVIGLELANLRCRIIDLAAEGSAYDAGDTASAVMRELLSSAAEPVVAYRHGRRWVESFAPVHLGAVTGAYPRRLRPGGCYLITGGLGGMGLTLADYLACSVGARLVLTGRSELPDRSRWASYLAAQPEDDAVSRKIRAVGALEAAGAEVMVAQADVAEAGGMRALVARVRERFGRIHGVVHAAGVPGRGLILSQEPAQAARVLAPKVTGTRVLEDLFAGAELDFLVLCSSLNAIKGFPGMADYCAANACLGAFARRFATTTGTFTVAIDWNRWRQAGMAVAAAGGPLAEDQGISNREGVEVFARVLEGCDEPQIQISEVDLETLLAGAGRSLASAETVPVEVAGGGEAAPEPAAGHARPELATEYLAPHTATERTLVEAWQTLFGIDGIGIHDDFYDLGGHSLLALQLLNRLNQTFPEASLSLRAIFDHPTVAQLAELIEPVDAAEDAEQGTPELSLRQRLLAMAPGERRHQIREHLRREVAREGDGVAREGDREVAKEGDRVAREGDEASPWDGATELGDDGREALVADLAWILKRDLRLPVYAHELRDRLTPESLAELVASELERIDGLAGASAPGPAVAIERPARRRTGARPGTGGAQPAGRDPRAVFVLTAPRSGSTLLRLMLGGHPALFCPPELSLLSHDGLVGWSRAMRTVHSHDLVLHAFMAFMGLGDREEGGRLLAELTGGNVPVGEVYRMIQERAGGRTLVDKTPTYAMRLEVLERAEELFEDARYLHLVRHPYAVIESIVRQRMDRVFGGAGDAHAIAERAWSVSHANVQEFCAGLDRRRWLRVRYERLVREPAEVMAEVCDFLGLGFEEAMLRPYDSGQTFGGLGDPDILTHRTIEARLADVWKEIRLPRRLAAITRELADELDYELRHEAQDPEPRARPRKWPLSLAQQRLWILSQLEVDTAAFNSSLSLRLRGRLDEAALRHSLDELVARHEVLRTTFRAEDGEPIQVVSDPRPQPLPVEDLNGLPATAREAEVRSRIRAWIRHSFDLKRGPVVRAGLWRLEARHHVLVVALHHLVYDGWSTGVLIRELAECYRARVSGRKPELADLPIQYGEYAARQRRELEGEAGERQLDHWRRQLAGTPDLDLPLDHARPPVQGFAGSRQSLELSDDVTRALEALSRDRATTLFTTVLAAFGVLLQRYTGQEDFAVGTLIANRDRAELEGLIGFFVNTVVVRLDLAREPTFRQLVARVREVVLGAFDNKDLPFERVVDEVAPRRDLSRNPLFQTLFVLHSGTSREQRAAELEIRMLKLDREVARFDLEAEALRHAAGLRLVLNYRTDLFEAATIRRMLRHFRALLEGLAARPDRPISRQPWLPAPERQQLLVEWNDTEQAPSPAAAAHELIAAQARQTPERVAVAASGDAGEAATQLTYAELDRRSDRLAARLIRRGVVQDRGDCLIGLCADRGAPMLIGMLGIMKAGGAYVPLDPDLPAERLSFMARDSALSALLTQEHLSESRPGVATLRASYGGPVLDLGDAGGDRVAPPAPAGGDRLAYVMFTSGSTGRPKGVQIPHRALVNFLHSMRRRPGIAAGDVLLALTTLSFDISVLELLLPLTAGARLEIVPRETVLDGRRLARRLAASRATVMQATPTGWSLLLESGWSGTPGLKVLSGGEALPPSVARRLVARSGELWNLYGPTETTIWSSLERLPAEPAAVSLGRPIANTALHVLDRRLRPAASGVPGELYIGGAGLARGYLNRRRRTAAGFCPNPWGPPGSRLYRTGDRVRLGARGRLTFLGRIDHQVKLRGHRIELGEIESVLRRHGGVREAVAVVRADQGDARLAAYVVGDGQVGQGELKDFLGKRLPAAMVPAVIVWLESLPLTPNRKVDRRALPAPEAPATPAVSGEPRTPVEEALVEIWSDLLGVERVGIHDNFFDLGGHSLLATRLVAEVERRFGVELPLRAVFESPTVAEQELEVTRRLAEDEDAGELERMIEEVEGLSDQELQSSLAEDDS